MQTSPTSAHGCVISADGTRCRRHDRALTALSTVRGAVLVHANRTAAPAKDAR
jgi:hypothetical protein